MLCEQLQKGDLPCCVLQSAPANEVQMPCAELGHRAGFLSSSTSVAAKSVTAIKMVRESPDNQYERQRAARIAENQRKMQVRHPRAVAGDR